MTKIILAAATATALLTATSFVGSTPAQAQSVEVGPGGIRVDPDRRDRGIMTATVGITAAAVGAEQSTRPERARVVASFVKEGRCAGINAGLKAGTPCSGGGAGS